MDDPGRGLLAWLISTGISALIGLIVGFIVVEIVSRFHRSGEDAGALPADAH